MRALVIDGTTPVLLSLCRAEAGSKPLAASLVNVEKPLRTGIERHNSYAMRIGSQQCSIFHVGKSPGDTLEAIPE